jgi:uncharacterized protein YndB with AHSA1/START domain
MFQTVFLALLVLIVALLLITATRPRHFRIARSTQINAPAETVFALVSDFHEWEKWSPWEGIDTNIQRTYSGATQGAGAVYEWRGNKDIGQDRMEITTANAPDKLVLSLHFSVPFEARNTVEFTLTRQGSGTHIEQAMFGPSPFISRLMGLFFSIEKMVGGKYETGLANLKALAEQQP